MSNSHYASLAQMVVLIGLLCGHGPAKADSLAKPATQNVLVIISDDLKASVLGCYGDETCHTPNIDRLADQGMVFERAYCQATWCAPSRQSLMHSRYRGSVELNVGRHFQDNGFHTARVGKIYHMRVPGDTIAGTNGTDVASTWTQRFNAAGLEAHTVGDYACLNKNVFTRELQGRQSTKTPHRPFVTVVSDGDGSMQADFKAANKAVELLRERKKSGQPFLLAVGFVRPHYPMVAPKKFFDQYDWKKIELPKIPKGDLNDIPKMGRSRSNHRSTGIGEFPDNQKRMWAGYYASVSFMDEQLGKVIAELERLGLRESTTIVFTSDHGYHLGEHQWWQKSNMHEEVTRVPLIISSPDQAIGRSDSIVELIDLYPTLTDLVGIEAPKSVQGKSLVPVLKNPEQVIRRSALTIDKGYSIRTSDYAYIRYNDGSEELYDMRSDPNQFKNLAGSEYHLEPINECRSELRRRLDQAGLPFDNSRSRKKNSTNKK